MNELAEFLFVPLILFLTVVCPIWIVFHYLFKKGSGKQLAKEERELLDSLIEQAGVMRNRIENLEAILDAQAPEWRKRQ